MALQNSVTERAYGVASNEPTTAPSTVGDWFADIEKDQARSLELLKDLDTIVYGPAPEQTGDKTPSTSGLLNQGQRCAQSAGEIARRLHGVIDILAARRG